jgi:hypothetical protein
MTFQLTYARAGIHRRFSPGQLSGPLIPCAYGSPLDASGSWEDGDDLCFDHPQRTEEQWINRYAGYAVNEAIHEALEWLRVDGRCWLDPHGPAKLRIYALTNGFIDQLAALRAEQAAPTDGTRK